MRGAVGNAIARALVPRPNFIFFIFFSFPDMRPFGSNRIVSAETAETDRFKSKPALNQAEIQVKKKVQNTLFELEALNKKP